VEQEGIVCSSCSTLNEPGWSFCQQCGNRLAQAAPPPPQPPAAPIMPADLRTIPEQHAVIDPLIQALKTNPEPQPAEHDYRTVVAQPPPFEPPLKTVADQPPPVEHKVAPKRPLPAAPPTVVSPPPAGEPLGSGPDDFAMRTVETPPPPKPTAPTPPLPVQEKRVAPTPPPPIPKPSIPPPSAHPASAPESTTAHGQSMSGALCGQCGQSNTVGSAFCASCGAPMTFGKTMVISSQPAAPPPKGRLHLVMEGGQPGEVYELEDDTLIGRNNGEITFPHDGFMSGRHARIERRGSSFILTDEGSRNGSFIKIDGEVELKPGDMILVGKQLFRFEV
jgi:FHA domain-containing protein